MIKNIYIAIVANKLVFDGNFPEVNEIIKEWEFQSNSIEKKGIKELFEEAVKNEGWGAYDFEISPNSIRITLISTFIIDGILSALSKENGETLRSIIEYVDKYVEDHKLIFAKPIDKLTVNGEYSQVLVVREDGQSHSNEFDSFLKLLENDNIAYSIEYEHCNAIEMGASGGFYEAIVFIKDTLVSGALYDLLKKTAFFSITKYKKERIDILKEKVAHLLYTQPENLEISRLKNDEANVFMEIRFNREKYYCEFNSSNEVVDFRKLI